jgi:serine phosphatase RsbU (regulator of sigma subunit)/anti-sigma regulatory factor (Ser/Thr protein kinase)
MPGSPPAFTRPVTLRRSLACDLVEVRPAVQSIHDFLAEQAWGENDLRYFDLALAEACNNAIEYAAGPGKPRPITLEAVSDSVQVEFRVHDHTAGFDWPEQIALPPPESESGRGLHLMASRMDYAAYFRGRGENLLVLRKNRPAGFVPPKPAPPRPDQFTQQEKIISDLVEELSSCYESLSAIFRYGAELGKAAALNEYAARLLRDLLRIVSAEWFVLRVVPRGEARLAIFAASEPALELASLALSDSPPGSLELEAARSRQTVWFDAQRPLPPDDPLAQVKPGSAGLVHPILLGEQLIGTVAIGRRPPAPARGGSPLTAAQTNVVSTFADFLAIQIANAHFQEEQIHRRLVSHELEIAANLQRSLLPATLPQLPGFTLAAFCRSAREVGGDFYDAIRINDHSLLLVIADVMGKGIPAAMFAAVLRALLRASPELTRQPAALLARVNGLLYQELSDVDMFITAQIAFVDAQAGRLTTASAGHCPLVLAAEGTIRTFSPEGMPLGLKPDTVFADESAPLPKHGRLLMYSDGLPDSCDAAQKTFGQQRLLDWLARDAPGPVPAEELKRELIAALDRHQSNADLKDDQTFLILCG